MAPWNEVISKFESGTLKSGGSGKKVSNPKQAVAIMLSEKRSPKAEYRLSSAAAAKIRAKAKGGK